MSTLAQVAAWHQAQADQLKTFLRLPMMLTESRPALEADIAFHEQAAVACREADGDEPLALVAFRESYKIAQTEMESWKRAALATAICRADTEMGTPDKFLASQVNEITKLLTQIEELKRDKARLDWLAERQTLVGYNGIKGHWVAGAGSGDTAREALDNAIAQTK